MKTFNDISVGDYVLVRDKSSGHWNLRLSVVTKYSYHLHYPDNLTCKFFLSDGGVYTTSTQMSSVTRRCCDVYSDPSAVFRSLWIEACYSGALEEEKLIRVSELRKVEEEYENIQRFGSGRPSPICKPNQR